MFKDNLGGKRRRVIDVYNARRELMSRAIEHIREIENVILGRSSTRDSAVAQSWQRCIESHRLDPSHGFEINILTQARLREHQGPLEQLIRTARSGLETLHRQMAGQGYMLVLADTHGVAVDHVHDRSFESQLRKAGLYVGAEWSEARAGTCGVGSCIVTGEALTIHQTDHFDVAHTSLTCTAAPIYDSKGNLAAILDISALRSPESKASQTLVLHMLCAWARRIELAHLMTHAKSEWVLRFSRLPDFVDVDPEGAIALDGSGRVVGMTHTGAKFLAEGLGLDLQDAGPIVGRPISDFMFFDLDNLPALTRGAPGADRLVVGRSGSAVFAHSIAPQIPAYTRRARLPMTPLSELTGGDPAMIELVNYAAKVAKTRLPVFIRGETGTGKERLARAIHDSSRPQGRFVAINCAALPEALIESELFGHAPGAFTGASNKGKKGLVEVADGGTLFLDEIGDMPLALQGRLLRVLAEGEVVPVGSVQPVRVDPRVLSATHRDLRSLVAEGRFREDLCYRLIGAVLSLPPLRDRSDFDWLADRLLSTAEEPPKVLSAGARLVLHQHRWPGNIRELRNILDVARALATGPLIEPADLPSLDWDQRALAVKQGSETTPRPDAPDDHAQGARPISEEARSLAALLSECAWNVSEVARRLRVDRTTVHRRMRRHSLVSPNHTIA